MIIINDIGNLVLMQEIQMIYNTEINWDSDILRDIEIIV